MICHTDRAESITEKAVEEEGTNEKDRDFTGMDFCAWTYDLFHPDEPYSDRGEQDHRQVGIDRYIKPSDLNSRELNYLKKQGWLQLINFISPMLYSNGSLKSRRPFMQGIEYNFAFRHLLTSFGHVIMANFFFQKSKYNLILAYHHFQNQSNHFPGIEAELFDFPVKMGNNNLYLTLRGMFWTQPSGQSFTASKMQPGGLLSIRTHFPVHKTWYPYLELEQKSHGWVAGNVFLDPNFSVRMGVSVRLKKQKPDHESDS
jgi:hypothetical protein